MIDIGKYNPAIARQSRTISIRGVEYCIHEWGDEKAPLLFYLHGWADTGSTFQFVVDGLASDWRVVAPDWRGFGRTAHCGESYWFPDYLADLHVLLNIYSAGEPVRIVGHSMGANVASLYAGTFAERVSALVNIEGFGLSDADPADAPRRYRKWIEASQTGADFATYPDYQKLAQRITKRSPGIEASQAEFVAREWAREDEGLVRLRADPTHRLPNPMLYRRAEAEACWRCISAAVLLVSGGDSPFKHQVGSVDALPLLNGQSCTITGVGHMIHFEAPQRLARQIEQFLSKYL